MAKIVINGRFLGMRTTGVQRFAREIVAELDKIVEPGQLELAVPSAVVMDVSLQNIQLVRVGKLRNQLWEHISFPLYALRKKMIPLNLCNVAPLLKPGIATVHDMKVLAHPEFFSRKFVLWYKLLFFNIAKRSKKILTVSDFSKKEIVKHFAIDSNKVVVVPNGWQHYRRIIEDDDALKRYNLKKNDYFFSMSSLDPNKNFRWIVDAAQKNPLQSFVIAGGVNAKVFSNNLDILVPKNLKFLGYVSDEESKSLMANAKAFLFPSFYEGFGIPPLEALSAGTSVVVSDIPVMREIFGTTVHYINPNDANVNLDKVMMENTDDSAGVLERYSWEKSARIMARIIRSTIL